MRILLAGLIFAVLTMPSSAQSGRAFGKTPTPEKPKADDRAYESAVKRMGDQSQAYDPWRNMREQPQSKDTPPKEPQSKEKPARGTAKR